MDAPVTQLFTEQELLDLNYTNDIRKDIVNAYMADGAEKASEEEITATLKALKDIDSNQLTRAKMRLSKDIQESNNDEAAVMASLLMEVMRSKMGQGSDVLLGNREIPDIPPALEVIDFVPGEISSGYSELSPDDIVE